MTEAYPAERPSRDVLRAWRSRALDAREAQHLRELIRRAAAGEFTREELTVELGHVFGQVVSREG
jgi:hypothetical protein